MVGCKSWECEAARKAGYVPLTAGSCYCKDKYVLLGILVVNTASGHHLSLMIILMYWYCTYNQT